MSNIDFSKDYKLYKNNKVTVAQLAEKYDRTVPGIRHWIINYSKYGDIGRPKKCPVDNHGLKVAELNSVTNLAKVAKSDADLEGYNIFYSITHRMVVPSIKEQLEDDVHGHCIMLGPLTKKATSQVIYDLIYSKLDEINAYKEAKKQAAAETMTTRMYTATPEEHEKLKAYLASLRK